MWGEWRESGMEMSRRVDRDGTTGTDGTGGTFRTKDNRQKTEVAGCELRVELGFEISIRTEQRPLPKGTPPPRWEVKK